MIIIPIEYFIGTIILGIGSVFCAVAVYWFKNNWKEYKIVGLIPFAFGITLISVGLNLIFKWIGIGTL